MVLKFKTVVVAKIMYSFVKILYFVLSERGSHWKVLSRGET